MIKSIAIIGGGICGLSVASALRNKFKLELFEKGDYNSFISGEHLPNHILNYFNKLEIPIEILKKNSIECLGTDGFWADKKLENEGIFNIGYDIIIDRPKFDKSLCCWLENEGVNVRLNSAVKTIKHNCLILSNNESLSFDLIIDCSGRTSNKFNNKRLVFDKQIGFSFYSMAENINNASRVTIESSQNGWWYFTSNKKYNISTYFTDSDIVDRNKINDIFRTTIKYSKNKLDLNVKPIIKTCQTSILEKKPKGIYQIGDSFMSFDPLSSKGVYKAMKDAYEFSLCIKTNKYDTYYDEKRLEFLNYLKQRTSFYKLGFDLYNTEFYKRRLRN